ncbi:MAG: multicopy suppressor of ts gsp1 [Lichina confinis]|nr:MAG: multicopy suppressor of ts gsp1 [Lichina confinis]
MSQYQPISLYGGAITVSLPTGFADVSTIRQVPDNQELYLSQTGFTSVVFDLTERVSDVGVANDRDALEYHFNDIVEVDDIITGRVKRWDGQPISILLAQKLSLPAYTLHATVHNHPQNQGQQHQGGSVSQVSRSKPELDFTAIILALIRLPAAETDVVITINVPHFKGEYVPSEVDFDKADLGPQVRDAMQVRDEILRTFEVKDWSLFGAAEGE